MLNNRCQNVEDNINVALSLRLLHLHNELKAKYAKSEQKFTQRELEIIELIALGFNSVKIGEHLFISKYTVDTHRKNIYRKGGFKCIRDVVLFSLLF